MKNLIMADLKVLGHRLWAIPLGISVLTTISALVLRGYQNSFMFIESIIIPVIFVLLSYSLMYYSENSKLHNEIGSLPCGSLAIVLEKYLVVLFFFGISFLANAVYLTAVSAFHDLNFGDIFSVLTVTVIVILALSLFVIPLFFKFKSAKTAYFGTIIWIAGLAVIFGTVIVKLFPFDESLSKNIFLLITMFILSTIAMSILYIMERYSGGSWKDFLFIPVVSILPVTVFTSISTLADIINQALLYNFMLPGYKRLFFNAQVQDHFADAYRISQVGGQRNYLLLNGITSIVLLGILFFVWKRGNIKDMIINAGLIFLPLLFLAIEISLLMSVYIIEIILSGNSPRIEIDEAWLIAHSIVFIPMLIVSIFYSKKFLTEGGK